MDLREVTVNDNRHPWERSRADMLLRKIERLRDCGLSASLVDIGAGDGFFARELSRFSDVVYAIDTGYDEDCTTARTTENIQYLCNLDDLPILKEGWKGIVMMDVLEHIEDDGIFLHKVVEKAGKGANIVITVPAYQFLFSDHDRFLKHFRRYSRSQLLAVIDKAGLDVVCMHYFYTSLFLVRLLSLPFRMKHRGVGHWRFGERHIFTRIIRLALNCDFMVCAMLAKVGILLPGLSLLAVCKTANRLDDEKLL
jgi:hypothetical protein